MVNKKVALVLGSGGARGLAHIGAIEALEERGYTITSIAGCSMGSIIAGMYAAGELKKAKEWFLSVDKQLILRMMDINLLSSNSLVKGQRIIHELETVVPDRLIENLNIPCSIVAPIWSIQRKWSSGKAVCLRPYGHPSVFRCSSNRYRWMTNCSLMAES
jgi:NTE family protein